MAKPIGFRTSLSRIALGAAFFLFLAMPLAAQESTTRGLHLGFHLQGASLKVEGSDPAGGGGAGFRVGYGINRIVTLFLEADGVTVEAGDPDIFAGEWALGHGEFGARFHFANSLRSWVPFLEAAIGGRAASVKSVTAGNASWEDVNVSGGVFSVGGGIYTYFTETVALELDIRFSGGRFTKIDLGPLSLDNLDIDASSSRFKVGIVWWP
jgi:hypothetical protein